MKKRFILLAILVVLLWPVALQAETYDYGFVLSCGMDFTYHSPTELTETERMRILHKLDQEFCNHEIEEEEEEGNPKP